MNETKYWLWLSMVFGTGSQRIWEAMRFFASAKEAFEELSSGFLHDRLRPQEIENIRKTDIENAAALIEQYRLNGIGTVGFSDKEYPSQIRHILNPPAVLFYKGNISCMTGTRIVTSVGARHASAYSTEASSRICGELARNGVVITSGFAVGIDIASHLAAASANRPTICVLGCGVDFDYPKENYRYRDMIIENGGVFISEFPPGVSPHPGNFPKRNRILSAIGRVTIVFEASKKSGSLITARLASEQGRDVFCLPPADIFSNSFSGNIMFLRDGAAPLYSAGDVLDCFKIGSVNDMLIRSEMFEGFSSFAVSDLKDDSGKKKSIETSEHKKRQNKLKSEKITENTGQDQKTDFRNSAAYSELEGIQKKIADLLLESSLHADVLAQTLGVDASELMMELTEMEISGIVRSLPGKMFEMIIN